MKAVKPFIITLAIVIAIGAIFLVSKSALSKSTDTGAAATKITKDASGSTKKKTRAKANPITKAIVSEALNSYVEQEGGEAKEMMDSMSAEDKDAVTEIIASNVTLDSISDLQNYASSNDSNALMDYAKDHFSEEDIQDLQEILEKYDTSK